MGTLIINVSGSLLIGFAVGLAASRLALTPTLRLLVVTGFLGGYTTFSTFAYETCELINAGSLWRAVANAAGSVLLGLLGVIVGIWLARLRALGSRCDEKGSRRWESKATLSSFGSTSEKGIVGRANPSTSPSWRSFRGVDVRGLPSYAASPRFGANSLIHTVLLAGTQHGSPHSGHRGGPAGPAPANPSRD